MQIQLSPKYNKGITLSLQNHFPHVLLEHLMTQFLFLNPQYEQA